MKYKVKILFTDTINGDFTENEEGVIDGYVRGADDRPYACVVIKDKDCVKLVPLNALQILE